MFPAPEQDPLGTCTGGAGVATALAHGDARRTCVKTPLRRTGAIVPFYVAADKCGYQIFMLIQ